MPGSAVPGWRIPGYTKLKALGSGGFGDVVLPLPRPDLQSLEKALAAAPQQAGLYVNTIFTPELYPYPDGPTSIGIDNVDFISKIQWAATSQGDLIGTGTLNWNTCNPDCAAGNSKTFPVKITASDPRMCTVVYPNGSNRPSQKIRGEVFGLIDIQSLQPGAPSFLTGDAVLKPCG